MYFKYDELPDRWDEFAGIFSNDAVLKGSFDKYASSMKRKRGTTEVDDDFLKSMESWRELLAKNLAIRNVTLSTRDLNFAVQRTLDRIIFLRICEDRGIEQLNALQSLLNGDKVYERLFARFIRADEKYNSGLFHFQANDGDPATLDTLTPSLKIDDKTLKEILKQLYYPDSPYEFSVLPADILGQVYEQFLGKIITLTSGHRAKLEEKPEVRKAGGVYYTPTYIVDYIVKQTVGKLLEDRTLKTFKTKLPQMNEPLCVLDPACGSGSFLIGAYQLLLDWHLKRYLNHKPESLAKGKNPPIRQTRRGDYTLTTTERKRILVEHIYGVDIDAQAVEVTKLSLLLKCLEGETEQTIQPLLLAHERALPDLATNIKCGNSLIGSDFYDNSGEQMDMFDDEERLRINVFDWNIEFTEILERGGFDAVIGNPPYVRMETLKSIKKYLRTRFAAHEERADLYAYFVERALQVLDHQGMFGMIVSNKFIKAKYGKPLRKVLSDNAQVEIIADFAGAQVFKGATVRTVIMIVTHEIKAETTITTYVPVPNSETISAFQTSLLAVDEYAKTQSYILAPGSIAASEWQLSPRSHTNLLQKLRKKSQPLAKWIGSSARFGLKTGLNEAFIITQSFAERLIAADPSCSDIIRPILFGRDVRRYHIRQAGRFVIYCHSESGIKQYPSIRNYMIKYRDRLLKRATKQKWYELQQPATALIPSLKMGKIVYPIIANECRFTIDYEAFFINDKLFMLPSDDISLLTVLNSRVANFYFSAVCAALEGGSDRYLEFRAQYVNYFPMPIRLSKSVEHTRLGLLGNQILILHQQLSESKTPHEKTAIQRQIDTTDRQIDQLVYNLYDLTDEEIKIVEGATK